jgi:hypothetical protein
MIQTRVTILRRQTTSSREWWRVRLQKPLRTAQRCVCLLSREIDPALSLPLGRRKAGSPSQSGSISPPLSLGPGLTSR